MNGLAILLAGRGFRVSGTDPSIGPETERRLEAAGVKVSRAQDGSNIDPSAGLVIATAALREENGDLVAARSRNIPVMKYAEALGAFMSSSRGIAVAGTHGKTTTTSFLVSAMQEADAAPGFLVGSYVDHLGGSVGTGKTDWFVAEACEYDRSFLNLSPHLAVVTGIEADHLDTYADLDEIIETFGRFLRAVPPEGFVIYNAGCRGTARAIEETRGKTLSCSIKDPADYRARRISFEGPLTVFEIVLPDGRQAVPVTIQVPGDHNVTNALMAFAAGHSLGLDPAALARGLGKLNGIRRRFEHRGSRNGIDVIDDYAHHPTEVRALVSAARARYPDRRLVVAFQPHQISRTRLLFDEFSSAFSGVDLLLLSDVYTARDREGTSPADLSEKLAGAVSNTGVNAIHSGDLEATVAAALTRLCEGDVFFTVGAGDITRVAGMILDSL